MSAAMPFFESAARLGVAILVNSLWQGALIALATWLALKMFPRANASTRYAAWALALIAIVAIPVLTSLSRVSVAQREIAAPATTTHAPAQKYERHHVMSGAPVQSAANASPRSEPATPAQLPEMRITVPQLAAAITFAAWLLAALVILIRLTVAFVQLERLKRDAMPLDIATREAMPRWQTAVKGERDIRICVSEAIEVPIAVGLFDSMILLPAGLVATLDAAEVDQISLHELAHLLRNDDWTNGLQRIASAFLFFNPAVWFVSHQLDIEREVACDDYVLELTGAVRPYAFCLTKMAEMTAWPHRPLPAPGVFVTRKNISVRIERLLRSGRAISSKIAPAVASAVLVALAATFIVLRTMTPSIAFTLPEATPAPAQIQNATHAQSNVVDAEQKRSAEKMQRAPHVVIAATSAPIRVAAAAAASVAVAHAAAAAAVASAVPKKLEVTVPSQKSFTVSVPMPNPSAILAEVDRAMTQPGCTGCDFERGDFSGKDFSGRNLTGSNFDHATLRGTKFDRTDLKGVNFAHADLTNASFVGARMMGCNLAHANLAGVRFDGADMTGCNVDTSTLSPDQARTLLNNCRGCDFAGAHLEGMDLRGVRLTGVNLSHANLRNADLRGAHFMGANFDGADLSGANVDGAEFIGCDFAGVNLRRVNLNNANMTGSDLRGAILRD